MTSPKLTTDDARQAERKKGMPTVLVASMAATAILMVATFAYMVA